MAAVKGGHVLAADWRGTKRYSVPKKVIQLPPTPPQLARTKDKDKVFAVGSVRTTLSCLTTWPPVPMIFHGVAHGSSEVLFGMQCWRCLCDNFLMSVHMGFCHHLMLWSV